MLMVIILFILGLLSYILRYVLNVILAHHMSMQMFGDYGVAIGVLTGLTTLLLLGTNDTVRKYVPLYKESGETEKLHAFIKWNIKLVLAGFFVYYLIIAAVVFFFFNGSIANLLYFHMAMYFLLMAPVAAVALLIIDYLLGEDRVIVSTCIDVVIRYSVLIVIALTAVYYVSDSFTNEIVIAAWVIVSLLTILLGLLPFILRKKNILERVSTALKARVSAEDARIWYKDAAGLVILGTIYALGGYLDLYVVEGIGSNEEMVGLYVAILSITEFFFIFPSATSKYVIPHISKMFGSPDQQAELQRRINNTNLFNVAIAVVLAAGIIIFREQILGIFGPGYVVASLPLCVSVIAVTLNAIGDLPDQLLTYTGFENQVTVFIIAEIVTLIGLGSLFCYYYGLLGVCMGMLVSMSLRLVLCFWLAKKKLPVKSLSII
nr:oligosaccharide flippase family protein [uncultured Methanoregula sp.]